MSERVFRSAGMGYVMELPDLRTRFEVDRLRRVSGELHGDVLVRSQWPGAKTVNGVLHASRFNLTAPATRRTVARLLAERAPAPASDQLDWYGFLEEFCQRVLTAEREGQPFEDVGQRPARIDPGMLIDPILPRRKPSILFGDGGTGKSFFAIGLAVSVVTGQPVIPNFSVTTTGPVLYLDWETDADDIDQRVKAVCAGARLDPITIRYRSCARILADQVEEISRAVTELQAALVIIDSVGLAAGTGSEGSDASESALRLFGAMRALKTTVLAIDHVGKAAGAQAGGAGKPYGSTYKTNLARSTWELRQAKTQQPGQVELALYHRKANTTARHAAIGLAMHFDAGAVYWKESEITDESLTDGLNLAERLAVALADHPLTPKELAPIVSASEGTIRAELNRHKDRFANTGATGWTLLSGKTG